jgi:hypothetical protein
MIRIHSTGVTFAGNLSRFLAALNDAIRRNRPGMTLLEYCREHS